MDTVIKVTDLHKSFLLKQKGSGFLGGLQTILKPEYKKVEAVDNLSFSISEGELLAFIGPNGAGKSTVIKMLVGILYPSGGHVSVLGFNPSKNRQKLAFKIGSVFGQRAQLWYHLAPQDTYDLFAKIYELEQASYKERLNFLVESFEIGTLLKTPVRKLSLGQRMRCEIVASLLHRPKIIFLDEPTIGLDVIAKKQIREVIKQLNKEEKVTVFLTSHDAGDIETLADRSIVINQGKIIFDDSTEKLKKKYIKTKTVELVVDGSTDKFEFKGGKIIQQSKYDLKVELDTSKGAIDKLLSYAIENFDIKDINIFDPPMEEIIAAIYQEARDGANA